MVLHRTMGFRVPDKVVKNRTALQQLMVGLAQPGCVVRPCGFQEER